MTVIMRWLALYSGTSLLQTQLGQLKDPDSKQGVLISGVVWYTTLSSWDSRQCLDYRGVLLSGVCL